MYKADYCLICKYMDEAIREVLPEYQDYVEYHRVDILKGGEQVKIRKIFGFLTNKDSVGRLSFD